MSTIGAKVQVTPCAAASMAAMRAVRRAPSGFQLLASASGTGKVVRKPWMTSKPNSSGMRARDCSTAIRCKRFTVSLPTTLRNDPSSPLRSASMPAGDPPGPVGRPTPES